MKYITLITLLFFFTSLSAQKDPIKWKEIAMEDLQMQHYEMDTSAVAVVLCDYGQYYFDTNPNGRHLFLFNTRYIRIKILKEDGLKYAKLSIPFTDKNCEQMQGENSIVIKGMVYNLSKNGELKSSKLKQREIKYRDSANCNKIAKINLPNVTVGSVIDYYYQIPTLDFVSPQSWNFQWEIPVRHSELRMRVPRYFQYMFSPLNMEGFDVVEETNYSRTLMFNMSYGGYRYRRLYNFDLSGKQMQFVKQYVEAFNHENFILNDENYYKKLNIHLVKATNENYGYVWQYLTHALFTTMVDGYENYEPIQRRSIIYPAGYILYSLPDWEKFTENLLKSERFGLPLIKHWEYEPYLSEMIRDKNTDIDKMKAIYDHVRENMNWTGKHDIYVRSVFNQGLSWLYTKITKKLIKEKSLGKPFEKKEGSSSEINFILISLLNKAGIKTRPVILSTNNHGKIDLNIPDPNQFNHVIALAEIGEHQYMLDATDSIRPYYLLDQSYIGKNGFLVDAKDFGWMELNNNVKNATNISENIVIDSNLNFSNKIILKKTGYDALDLRRAFQLHGEEETIQQIEQETGLSNIKTINNLEDEESPINIEIQQQQSLNANLLRIYPKLNPVFSEKDFQESIRNYPVEFKYPFSKFYSLQIDLPDGFECILPSDSSYSSYGGNAFYSYKTVKNKNRWNLTINLEIKMNSFPALEYANLAQLFAELNEKLKEPIIIRKK